MNHNLIQSQIAYASVVAPAGEIVPAWSAFLKNHVEREGWIEWANTPDKRELRDDILAYDNRWNIKNLISWITP